MDGVRYVFALLWLVSFPTLLFWIGLHPYVAFWRRMGLTATYTILLTGCATLSVLLYSLRGPLLAVEFGTHPALWALTALAYGGAVAVETRARRHLKVRTLFGVPELRGEASRDVLLTEGIYAKVRHPRYVGVFLGYLASAFFANHLLLYVAVPGVALLLHTIVLLEERELLHRFGDAYADYMRRVPRYLPRRAASTTAP